MSNEAGESIFRSRYGAVGQLRFAPIDDIIGNLHDHFLQNEAEVAASPEITGGNIVHAPGMGAELIAFAEASPGFVFRIVNRYGMTAVFAHDSEAGDIGGPITDVDHIGKWHWAK